MQILLVKRGFDFLMDFESYVIYGLCLSFFIICLIKNLIYTYIYIRFLNDKKIYNELPHMSCSLIQTFRPSGFFRVFTKSKPGSTEDDFVRMYQLSS